MPKNQTVKETINYVQCLHSSCSSLEETGRITKFHHRFAKLTILSFESPNHDQFISISFKFIFVFYRFHSLNTRTANSTDGSRSPNWANTIALFASTKAIDPHTIFPTSLIVMARSRMNRIIHITMALIIYFLMCSIYQRALLVVNNFILWNAKKKERTKMQQKCTITLKLKRRTTSADHHNIVQMYLTRLTRFKTSWV